MVDLQCISRVDRDGAAHAAASHAWVVADPRGGDSTRILEDADHGGALGAFLAAVKVRDQRDGRESDLRWTAEGLERVARGGIHGWWISVQQGSILDADLFEDEQHGGPGDALRAALAWRTERNG